MIEASTIERVARAKGEGLPVVSLYVRIDQANRRSLESQITALLEQIRPTAYDESVDREARISLRNDINRIRQAAQSKRWNVGAVSIFSCSGRGLFEEVQLPRAVHDRVVLDETPWIRPMLAVLDEYHRTCVLVIDKRSARMWEVYQDEMREAATVWDPSLRQPNYSAGAVERKEAKVHNRAQVLRNRHYRRVVDVLDQMFRTGGFDVLAIGGHDFEVPGFIEFLPQDLRQRVIGTFNLDPGTAAAAEIRSNADKIIDRFERDEERRLVTEVLDAAAAGGRAVAGLQQCLWAGSVAAIDSLVVQEGSFAPGVVCDESAWLGLPDQTCALCGGTGRPVPDVIDELVTAVIDDGGTVKHVQAATPLAEQVVAAKLRFPLPPRP